MHTCLLSVSLPHPSSPDFPSTDGVQGMEEKEKGREGEREGEWREPLPAMFLVNTASFLALMLNSMSGTVRQSYKDSLANITSVETLKKEGKISECLSFPKESGNNL